MKAPVVSIVIPAHNEAAVIDRLLDALDEGVRSGDFEVIVAANGCTDDTARRAASHEGVSVLDLAEGSKIRALDAGDDVATVFPRLYVDADVYISADGVRELVRALQTPGVLAAAPRRDLVVSDSTWPVRAYFRVWSELPGVQRGLYGRGVIGVTEAGHARIVPRPTVLGDDLFVHQQFSDSERLIVDGATVTVRGPKYLPDLVHRRVRVAMGNVELPNAEAPAHCPDTTDSRDARGSRDSLTSILRTGALKPARWPSIVAFVAVTVYSRWQARRLAGSGTSTPWLRDESSRT